MRRLTNGLVSGMLLVGMVGGAVAAQDDTDGADAGPLTEVADGVYHFWDGGYSSLVVIGEDGILVTDPAWQQRAELMQASIAEITDRPVDYVVLSHEHYDHAGGTEVFEAAELVCHEACADILALSPILEMPEVDIEFETSRAFDLGGGIVVEVVHIAPSDGVGASVVRVDPANVVFSADLYVPESFSPAEFKEDTNFVGLRETLDTLVAWEPSYAINGHSPGDSRTALEQNATLISELEAAVTTEMEAALAEGGLPAAFGLLFTLPNELTLDGYDDWADAEANFPAYVRRMALSIIHGG